MGLSGSLADFPLEGVLRLLESTRKTGMLEISGGGEVGRLEITDGGLSAAYAEDEKGDSAVASILEMGEADFAFRPSSTGPANLTGSAEDIFARARALQERRAAVRTVIPNDRMRFELSPRALSGGTISISPEHWKVLLNVDGRRDVQALAGLLGETRIATLERLNDLVAAGLIDAREPLTEERPQPAPPPARPAAAPAAEPPAEPAWPAPRRAEPAAPKAEAPVFKVPEMPVFEPAPEPPVMKAAAPESAPPAAERHTAPPEPATPAPSWPAPEPAVQPPTDDLSKLLEQRLAALDRPAPRTPPSPQDFWEQVQQSKPAEPPPFAPAPPPPPSPAADTDDRLAALLGTAAGAAEAPFVEKAPFTEKPAFTEAPPAQPAPEPSPFAAPQPSRRDVQEPVASHYLPPDTTAPILEADAQAEAPKEEKKRGGLFGFGRKKEPSAPTSFVIAPAAPQRPSASASSSPGRLASFANALIAEYNSGQYGKQRLDERMNVRLRLVDEQADPLDRMLPVQDDRLDVGAIERDFVASQASPYLATLVRQVFDDAERVFGRDKAKKGYRAAIKNALGGDEGVLHDGVVAPILPKL